MECWNVKGGKYLCTIIFRAVSGPLLHILIADLPSIISTVKYASLNMACDWQWQGKGNKENPEQMLFCFRMRGVKWDPLFAVFCQNLNHNPQLKGFEELWFGIIQ